MDIQRWVGRREQNWQQLEELLTQVEQRGLQSLNAQQIALLASLYRSVSANLVRARTHQVSDLLVQKLQRLTTRSYSQIYQSSRRQEWRSIEQFFRWDLPAVVQRSGAGF